MAFKFKEGTLSITEYLEKLFEIANTAKALHLAQLDRKLSTHLVLGELYDALSAKADDFIETYFGIYGTQLLSLTSVKVTDPIEYLQDSYHWLQRNRNLFTESMLQNKIDEIQALVAHSLYKLKFVL